MKIGSYENQFYGNHKMLNIFPLNLKGNVLRKETLLNIPIMNNWFIPIWFFITIFIDRIILGKSLLKAQWINIVYSQISI